MHIERLALGGFRNLAPLDLVIDAPTVLVVGDNAQGKTNLLEAVHLCATGRSFRAATPAEFLAQPHPDPSQARAWAKAMLSQRGVRHEVRLQWAPVGPAQSVRQRLLVDGRGIRQAADLLAWLNVVAFFPEDLRIAKAGPEARRRFFDRAVAGGRPAFVAASVGYQRALKARNALLRERGHERALLAVYDDQLAGFGAAIHVARVAELRELRPYAQAMMEQLLPGSALHCRWHSGFEARPGEDVLPPDADEAHVEGHLKRLWERSAGLDRLRGITMRGPHRADLVCQVDGRDARAYASQGQQRCLVLALKVAELQALTARQKSPPLLLLDDVSSELDATRLQRLFAAVAPLAAQTFISSTGSVPLPLQGPRLHLRMRGGRVHKEGA